MDCIAFFLLLFFKDMLALLQRKRHHEGGKRDGVGEEERKITVGVWRSRESKTQRGWKGFLKSREGERYWVKRAEESTILWWPRPKAGARALSPASVTVETAAHISTSPGESKSPPGENEGRETKKQSISFPVPFCCQMQKWEEKEDEEGLWVLQWMGLKAWQRASHSSIAPKLTAFVTALKNKAKVKVEKLTGEQQLYMRLYLACTVRLRTQAQSSLYSISHSVKGSANKALYM